MKLAFQKSASTMPIKQLTKNDITKICNQQVVISLSMAVKELIENSIDAGTTYLEISLKKKGLEQIDVIDKGSGIKEDDHKSIG